MAAEALRQFNLKFLQPARENSEATFEFLTDIINAKDIQAAGELWTKHAQRQQELWSRQAREIPNLRPNDCQAKAWIRFRRTSIQRLEPLRSRKQCLEALWPTAGDRYVQWLKLRANLNFSNACTADC